MGEWIHMIVPHSSPCIPLTHSLPRTKEETPLSTESATQRNERTWDGQGLREYKGLGSRVWGVESLL